MFCGLLCDRFRDLIFDSLGHHLVAYAVVSGHAHSALSQNLLSFGKIDNLLALIDDETAPSLTIAETSSSEDAESLPMSAHASAWAKAKIQ